MTVVLQYEVGETVDGRFRVIEPLGHGGMGATYRAVDMTTGTPVVVKIPSLALIGDPATFSRYERELKIGQLLEHPRVQRLIGSGQLRGGAPYMVLEYVEGEPMRRYLSEHAPLPLAEAIRLTAQVAETLQYCHEHGVVHRDLKPENLLITPAGDVILLDFGIALLQGARRLTFSRLTSGVGTPDYMAPEQVSGERGDARTDVYSVGVLLYEMLTGEVPFRGDNPLAVMSQRLTTDPPSVRGKRPEVSPQLDSVARRALRRDRVARYPSMAALRDDLLHLDAVVAEPDTARSSRATEPGVAGDLPNPRALVLLIGIAFGALALVGLAAQLIHRAQQLP